MSRWRAINLIVAVTVTCAAPLLPAGVEPIIAVVVAGLSLVVGSELVRHGVAAALRRADADEQKVGVR